MKFAAVGGDGVIGGVHERLLINSCLAQEDIGVTPRHGAVIGGETKVFAVPVTGAFLNFLLLPLQNSPCFLHHLSSHQPLLPLGLMCERGNAPACQVKTRC